MSESVESICRKAAKKYLAAVTGEPPSEQQLEDYLDDSGYCEEYVENFKQGIQGG